MIKCALQFEIFTILNSLQLSTKLNQIKCWFLERGENRSTRRKTSRSRVENQQTQPTYDAESGNRTRDTLVEGERSLCGSHHSQLYRNKKGKLIIKLIRNLLVTGVFPFSLLHRYSFGSSRNLSRLPNVGEERLRDEPRKVCEGS